MWRRDGCILSLRTKDKRCNLRIFIAASVRNTLFWFPGIGEQDDPLTRRWISTRLRGVTYCKTVLFKIKRTLKLLEYNASVLNLLKSMFLETKYAEKQTRRRNKGKSYKGKILRPFSFFLWIAFTAYFKLCLPENNTTSNTPDFLISLLSVWL
jgi:hypothetical protein